MSATANIANRTPRHGRLNPGRKHLAGADVTDKMQRQYEHILQSLRESRRYRMDAKRKQVAAAAVRKLAKNPSLDGLLRSLGLVEDEERQAEQLAEAFHGREVEDVIDATEVEEYDEYGAVLGYLAKLAIETEDGEFEIPITFPYDPLNRKDNNILVVSNPAGTNIEFVGGDQKIDWRSVEGASLDDKYLVLVGAVREITYFADKHHLSGPKAQRRGIEYYHEFGEDDGELPYLVYDRRNAKLLLVGGNYTVEPEGITG